MEGFHDPVLLWELIGFLQVECEQWYLDCTLGDGGHSLEVLKLGGKIVGLDVDPEGLKRAEARFKEAGYTDQDYKLFQINFRDLKSLLQAEFLGQKFSGVYFDLGVSSLQFETPQRGFSFLSEAPLDMRMDPNLQVTALDLIKALNKGELYEIFTKFGEEKYSRQLADVIVSSSQVINTTRDLAELVEGFYKRKGRVRGKIHSATKIFQALRIAVNDELNALKETLPQAFDVTLKGGRVAVISFHSLEDRIVKDDFKSWQLGGLGQILTKKPISPTDEEINQNPRSRSAKLRVFLKK